MEPLYISSLSTLSSPYLSSPQSPKRSTARSTRLAGGPHEPKTEPTQWVPCSNSGPSLRDTLPIRTNGTGYSWTTADMSGGSSPICKTEFLQSLTSRSLSPSKVHDPAFLNGSFSLHRTAKATGQLSPTRHHMPTAQAVASLKFATQPLQRGGITTWGHR